MSDLPRPSELIPIVAAAAVGVAAGMAGALLVAAYVLPPTVPDIGVTARRIPQDISDSVIAFRSGTQAVVRFFDGPGQTTPAGTLWNASEQVATGVLLTADGWVVTDRASVPDRLFNAPKQMRVVTEGGRAAEVERLVDSPTLGLVFFKTTVRDAPVAVFGDSRDIGSGTRVFVPGERAGAFAPLSVIDSAARDSSAPAQETSADFRRRVQMTGSLPRSAGTPVLSLDGELIGVLVRPRAGENVWLAVPVEVVRATLSEVLASGKATFVDVGLVGIPLHAVQAPLRDVQNGLVVTEVKRGSPAATAGLQVGDVIRAIGSDAIDGRAPFAERFASYPHDGVMDWLVLRNDAEERITVTRP